MIRVNPWLDIQVVHFESLDDVDETQIDSMNFPEVIIHQNDEGKHMQIKVVPFNYENADKEDLVFSEKIVYYRKTVRDLIRGGGISTVLFGDQSVLSIIVSGYLDETDAEGIADELAEFQNGIGQ